ncbi:MAG: S8 family serine peptidase [Bacteroidetes bacterium]|nr:S8 family serine peptidase [Bacteroidota bacterium]
MKRRFTIIIFLALALGVSAQEQLIREESFVSRMESVSTLPPNPEERRAVQVANGLGIPTRLLYPDGRIVAVRRINSNGKPEYLTTLNKNAAGTVSTSKVWLNGGAGLNLSGEGLVVGVWDGGVARSTHQEFGSRARIMNPAAEEVGHATHVSGTIAASGVDSDARGMAGKVVLEAYDWDNDLQEMRQAAADGLLLSNHSYGFIVGFDFDDDEDRWQWWGDTDVSEEEDYNFGYYHGEAKFYDEIAYSHQNYLIVKSAGNDRGEGPSPGAEHFVWVDGEWESSTAVRQRDGGDDGYGCLGPVSTAKNIMVVGSVRDLPNGYGGPESVKIAGYSAFGPTDDGRIKPDVVGNGESLWSSYSGGDDKYRNTSGTSMSAPNVTGSMLLLQEHHQTVYGSYMKSASLKGLVLHTADDAGNIGPDYIFGWGLMNTESAAAVISNTDYQQIQEHTLDDQEEVRLRLFCDGSEPLRVTLSWTDLAGQVPSESLNPTNRILVNDLDMRVTREVDGLEYRPFVLDPVQPSLQATTGDNILDNVEQVFQYTPEKGFYEIVVRHKGTIKQGRQNFSLIISGLSSEFFASGTDQLTDNNGAFFLTSSGEYLPGMDAGWLITPENGQPVSLSFSHFDTEADHDILTVYDGGGAAAPVLAQFSGVLLNSDTLVQGTGDSLFVSFHSDDQNQGEGFTASYCTTPPEGEFLVEGESFPCTASTEIYVVSGQDGTLYNWLVPADWELLESGRNYAEVGTGTVSGSLQVEPYNRCGESAGAGIIVQSLQSAPHPEGFTGDTVLCVGEPGVLSVDSLAGATYEWMLPVNWQGSSESNEISFIPSPDQGEVRVSARNSCAYGDTLAIPILLKTVPGDTPLFSVYDKICKSSVGLFYLVPEEGAEYQWSVEGDWTIAGEDQADTVEVLVGMSSNYLFVDAVNECGSKITSRFFLASDQPDQPLLIETGSVYDYLRELKVQNATDYSLIQWYLNSSLINSPMATGPTYVAYIPGTYSVGVTNRDGCTLLQEWQDGIEISGPDALYAVFAGSDGALIVHNTAETDATLNVYDYQGRLLMIIDIEPGYNEVPTSLTGVCLVSVRGEGKLYVTRLFLR